MHQAGRREKGEKAKRSRIISVKFMKCVLCVLINKTVKKQIRTVSYFYGLVQKCLPAISQGHIRQIRSRTRRRFLGMRASEDGEKVSHTFYWKNLWQYQTPRLVLQPVPSLALLPLILRK